MKIRITHSMRMAERRRNRAVDICDLALKGEKLQAIARHLGLTTNEVFDRLRKAGFPVMGAALKESETPESLWYLSRKGSYTPERKERQRVMSNQAAARRRVAAANKKLQQTA